ncbi:hypothetical protein TVAG_010060 [Trichomonas vaginalis G3]|uniref:ATPase AAA-type core domain-containing protein n=1 Tax=Trichomonas vaginalis (strain ATCC PRA-98 / G3) TaxID=412133 RepID=A2FA23_TRIV3|nr:P-loop containing nucleoside triphosphate hydrolases family [Trichomonas vaginalis G3]EAX98231.1 hypothetical protein TVAG_010060 [Trichomonas vaginalis G3]KAI5543372.1 P-loop containing nucleoside triphosphate hydrolases family [Trichomonas vaginalis G3]|eukprot:XP_001311161.1 hypothetical protein [Trichomonas vaginalis G3]
MTTETNSEVRMPQELDEINALFQKKPEVAQEEPKKSKLHLDLTLKTKIKIGVAVFILILGIIIKILLKKEIRTIDTPMKYVKTAKIATAINSFVHSSEPSDITILYGPKGFGKTRGLNIAVEQLKSSGKFVVNLDFSVLTKESTVQDIITIIKSSIITAFKNTEMTIPSIKLALPSLASLTSIVGVEPPQIGGFQDPTVRQIASSLCTLIDTIGKHPSSTEIILRGFDVLGNVFLVVNEPQNAIKLPIYNEFLEELQKISSGSHHISCIAEISDVEWLLNQPEILHAKRIYIDEFTLEEAKEYLAGDFKPRQISEMFDAFGGNGRLFALVHETMRLGLDFKEALQYVINIEQMATKQALARLPEGGMPTLLNLTKSEVNLDFNNTIARFLIDEYLATPIRQGVIKPLSKITVEYLKTLDK